MSIAALEACAQVRHPTLNSTDYLALDAIALRYWEKDRRAIITMDQIAMHIRADRRTARRSVAKLVRAGVIERPDGGRGGRGKGAVFTLPRLVNTSENEDTALSAFSSENEDTALSAFPATAYAERRTTEAERRTTEVLKEDTALSPSRISRSSRKQTTEVSSDKPTTTDHMLVVNRLHELLRSLELPGVPDFGVAVRIARAKLKQARADELVAALEWGWTVDRWQRALIAAGMAVLGDVWAAWVQQRSGNGSKSNGTGQRHVDRVNATSDMGTYSIYAKPAEDDDEEADG